MCIRDRDKTVNRPNRTHASLILSLGEIPFRVEKGATYAVTFDYYVQSTNVDNLDKGEDVYKRQAYLLFLFKSVFTA